MDPPGSIVLFVVVVKVTQCLHAGAAGAGPGAAADPHNYCYTYAVLRERPGARRLTVCGRRDRHAVIYTSLSNSVQVRVIRPRLASDDSASYFLLEYQGLVIYTRGKFAHPVIYISTQSYSVA